MEVYQNLGKWLYCGKEHQMLRWKPLSMVFLMMKSSFTFL